MNAKPCGLIPVIPPLLHAQWTEGFADLVSRFLPAALVLSPPFDAASAVIAAAKPFEIAVLLRENIDLAQDLGAGGVYLTGEAREVGRARQALGSGAVLGAGCALSRHQAMEKAEAGADFIAFEAVSEAELAAALELSLWWSEVTQIPCALALPSTCLDLAALREARPDFLLVEEKDRAGESLTFATEFGLQSER